ncbi:contractile injection system tape measure protein [Dickeya chrysanthemi]|uniref:contractile injection system tape measure protein n=1 Tax=Dickeya chrysanthemi TaxID=556 RepID=UPI0025A2EB36|nr:contractile injection system tape measure protein [Dickeya chrysanthemi]WJM84552.1 contractile injection system tape measure protein [Dickeya chrysanthemi]
MTQPHRIHTASLTLDFCHPSEAERFERDAPHFVQHQLLPLIDALFDQSSPPHQLWVIDQLTLDLGALPASDLASALLAALRQQLAEALRAQQPAAAPASHTHEAETTETKTTEIETTEIQILDGPAAQWRQLQFFLQHGVMPWHYADRHGWRQATHHRHWLADAVRRHYGDVNRLLSASARPADLIARLVSQLPATALHSWLEQLTPAHQDMALCCLAAQPEPEAMPATLRGRLHRYWHRRIHQALSRHRLRQELLPVWATLLGTQRPRFLLALYACGQQPDVVRAMAQALDDNAFNDLLTLLAPQAQPFIQQVLGQPAWFSRPDEASAAEQPPSPHPLLREFTLHYLLVQRGGQFNKQRYMAGLIGRLAAHYNMARTDVLQTLYLRLAAWPGDRALKQPLLSLLTTLWGEMAPLARPLPRQSALMPGAQPVQRRATVCAITGQPDADIDAHLQMLRRQWAAALQQADEAALNQVWRQCPPAMLSLLRPELIASGQQSQLLQRWAVRFSAAARYRLLTLLEPADAPFIRDLLEEVRVGQSAIAARSPQSPGDPLLTHSLWSLTFSYLLAGRGGEFNRNSYLETLLRQLAAHHNLSHSALVDALLQHVRHTPADTEVRRALLSLLHRLHDDETPAATPLSPPSPPTPPPAAAPSRIDADFPTSPHPLLDAVCYQYLHEVLVHGDPARRYVSPDRARAASAPAGVDLLRCLQQLQAHHPLLVQRWLAVSTHYPAGWQRLCAALRPSQAARLLALLIMLRQPSASLRSLSAALDNVTRRLSLAQQQAFYGQMIASLAANHTPDWVAIRDAVSHAAPHAAMTPPQTAPADEPTATMPAQTQTPPTPTLDDDGALAVLQQFAGDAPATLTDREIAALCAALARLLTSQPEAIRRILLPVLHSAAQSERLATALPDTLHTALLLLLRRSDFLALQPYGRFIANLCHRHPAYYGASQALEHLLWRALYHALFTAGSSADIATFIRDFLHQLAADWQTRHHTSSPAVFYRFLLEQAQTEPLPATRTLADRVQRLITDAGLHQDTPPAATATAVPSPEQTLALPPPADLADNDEIAPPVTTATFPDWRGDDALPADEPIAIANAGLVLASPYLARLLTRLALVQDGAFPEELARYQAIYCLQYLVDPQPLYAEYQLALNKLLCGLPLNAPLPLTMPPDAAARDTLDALLAAILQHWNALGHTTADGLRQTFLQREGTLWRQADSWKLEVMPGPFDMLLDRLPWGYSTIKYPWMDRPLHVVWR